MLGFIKMSVLSAVLSFGVVTAIDYDWSNANADAGSTKIYTDRVAAASLPPLPAAVRPARPAMPALSVERSGKGDRAADVAPTNCQEQSWPHVSAECLSRDDGRPRPSRVRVITIEQREGAVSILQRVRDVEVAHR
jgi:hypothetical protein